MIPDFYEAVPISKGKANKLFLYVLHMVGANNLQVGFGMESVSKLQRAHIVGPQVHHHHAGVLSAWLRRHPHVTLTSEPTPRLHPFTSAMDNGANTEQGLEEFQALELSAGRYHSMVDDPDLSEDIAKRLADAIDRVHNRAFDHPQDWVMQFTELKDGRFVWFAYDGTIDKIRIGLGHYDNANNRVFGKFCYALHRAELPAFCASHFQMVDSMLPFWGLPPSWPTSCVGFLAGPPKQDFIRDLLLHADRIWPGQIP